MATDSDEKLFKQLDEKHPDYKAWKDEWERYRDVLGDVLVDEERHLPKNMFEPLSQYDFRVEMSEFIPESSLVVDRLIGALYKESPKRDLKGQASDLKDFLERSTKKKRWSWDQTVEEIAWDLLGYGTTRILVNVPAPGMSSLSRKEEQDLGVRPWLTMYSPLSVIDWEYDDDGALVWARIKEIRIKKTPDVERKKGHYKEVKFIDFTASEARWWIFNLEMGRENKAKVVGRGNSEHGLGVVPMVIDDLREISPAVGSSFIRYSSKADLIKFRAESDLGYDTYIHAHPYLAIWTEDELKDIGVGTTAYLKLHPGSPGGTNREDAKYIDPPTSAFDALMRVIDEQRLQIARQGKTDPMGLIASGEQGGSSIFQASGSARAWSFGTSEARVLKRLATKMEGIERQILDLVLRWGSKGADPSKPIFTGDITYPEEFDLASTSQLLAERAEIAASVNSPILIRAIDKRIAASKVGDTTAETVRKINDEIDKNPLLGTQAGRTTSSPFEFPGGAELGGEEPGEGAKGRPEGRTGPQQGRGPTVPGRPSGGGRGRRPARTGP